MGYAKNAKRTDLQCRIHTVSLKSSFSRCLKGNVRLQLSINKFKCTIDTSPAAIFPRTFHSLCFMLVNSKPVHSQYSAHWLLLDVTSCQPQPGVFYCALHTAFQIFLWVSLSHSPWAHLIESDLRAQAEFRFLANPPLRKPHMFPIRSP